MKNYTTSIDMFNNEALNIYNLDNERVGTITLNEGYFAESVPGQKARFTRQDIAINFLLRCKPDKKASTKRIDKQQKKILWIE